jgi:V/A-type H+/Na+-transporting ATPase subunit E
MTDALKTSSGVEKLIERLRDEGVKAGEASASKAVEEAERQAAEILIKAQRAADEMLAEARQDLKREQIAAKEALNVALRDSVLDLKERLTARFKAQVRSLIEKELRGEDFLRQVIIAVAGSAAPPADQAIEILFSAGGGPAGGQVMDSFILSVTKDVLRQGVEFTPTTAKKAGIRIAIRGTDLEIDLTEEALSDLILRHLTPRFRELMEGTRR